MIPNSLCTLNRHIPRWFPTIAISAVILYLTLDPNPVDTSDMKLFPGADKVAHAIMFGAFAVVLLYDWNRHKASAPRASIMLATGALAIAFGALVECLQPALTTTRSGDPYDLVADAAGVVLALAASHLFFTKYLRV